MGKRGPPKSPTKVLQMRGSWRGDDRGEEPQPARLAAPAPDWLRPLAKEVWKILYDQLTNLGVIGDVDENTLARYCQTYAKWREAEDYIVEHGSTTYGAGGEKAHPMATLAVKYSEQLTRLEAQFGMTPSSRANLAKPKDAGGEKNKFFGDTG